MSHFTVLVIGKNVEEQLQPYHEFECTGTNDEHVQSIDVTGEVLEQCKDEDGNSNLQDGLEWYGLEDSVVKDEQDVDTDGKHKFGFAIVNDGKLSKAINRTNQNSKWDWWLVGGRWTGFFELKKVNLITSGELQFDANGLTLAEIDNLSNMRKEDSGKFSKAISAYGGKGADVASSVDEYEKLIFPDHEVGEPGLMTGRAKAGRADSAQKKFISIDGMRLEAREKAGKVYDEVIDIIGEHLTSFVSWEKMRDNTCKGDINKARIAYNSQPAVIALRAGSGSKYFSFDIESVQVPRAEYVDKAGRSAMSTFAVVKDGKWYQKGEMGWWGCVSDEKEHGSWDDEFSKLIDSTPEDTLMTVVDCHI